jgi:hypothetical protein
VLGLKWSKEKKKGKPALGLLVWPNAATSFKKRTGQALFRYVSEFEA